MSRHPHPNEMKPLAVDLYCGLGGWTEGFLAEGYRVVGFDIERHGFTTIAGPAGNPPSRRVWYPAQLVIQDVLTIHGSQFRDAAVIVASPPCQKYSYLAMPWSRSSNPNNSKAAKALRKEWETNGPDNRLFDACFRIQREAIEATRELCRGCAWDGALEGCANCMYRHIPLIVENVRGAIPWVGRSAWNYGSFHLWGDVPALMPTNLKRGMKQNPDGTSHPPGSLFRIADSAQGDRGSKNTGGSWFNVAHNTTSGVGKNPVHELAGQKTAGHVNQRDGFSHTRHLTNQAENDAVKQPAGNGDWFSKEARAGSKSHARKLASAQIAKIPLPLAQHIASVFKPRS